MAIKVQGTTVIDDARHISNIGVATVGILSANQITTDGSTNQSGVGVTNYVLTSGGTSGDISWQPVTAVGSGTLDGINILEEGSQVGSAGSVININFVGNNVTATGVALGLTATVTISDDPTYNSLNVTGDVAIASTVGIGTRIDLIPYDTIDNGTLSFEGSAGQLFSITNDLTSGSIFSVNDVSGIPSIDVDADGTVLIAPYGSTEYVGIGTTNPTQKLDVVGTVKATSFTGDGSGLTNVTASTGTATTITLADESTDTECFLIFATDATGDQEPKTGSNLTFNSNTGALTATSFVKESNSGGFLKADGTEDTSTYLTSYTESQTLDDVVGLGSTTAKSIGVGTITATEFVVDGGSSTGFLKADGSIDSTPYSTGTGNLDAIVIKNNGQNVGSGSTFTSLDFYNGIGVSTTPTVGLASIRLEDNISISGIFTATSFESTVSTGTAPFVVASTTKVTNLNADLLDGKSTANGASGNTVVIRNADGGFDASDVNFANVNASGIITATGFATTNGTSSQFLKADGSVDSSTYLTSYTETQTLNDVLGLGNTSSTGLSVGIVTATSFVKESNSGGFLKADGTEDTNTYLTSYTETQTLNDVLGLGNTSSTGLSVGVITATSFVKDGGTSSQFLKADGSVDSSTYLTSYTETQTLDDVLGLGNTSDTGLSVGIVTATSFVKDGGTSSQFLKADGSVDSSTYLTSYTETQTLDDVLGLGNTSSTGLSVGVATATSFVKSSNSGGFLKADGVEDTNTYLTSYTETQALDDVVGLGSDTTQTITVGTATTGIILRPDGTLNVSGVSTFQGNVYLGDNDNLYFGDGSDLRIYHESSTGDSVIRESGTGNLRIGGANVEITSPAGSETYASFNVNGAVELYYDNSKKFETVGTGVSVFGTLETQQLNVSGVSTFTSTVEITPSSTVKALIIDGTNAAPLDTYPLVTLKGSGPNGIDFRDASDADGLKLVYRTTPNQLLVENSENTTSHLKIDRDDGRVELNYGGNKKFETTDYGIYVTGAGNTSTIGGAANLVLDPTTVGDNTGTVTILGNLQVEGTQTIINSTTLEVDDKLVSIAKSATNASQADGAGLEINGASATLTYASTGDKWVFNKAPYYNTNRILTTADEGTGNGLDADTVDGIEASSFLRSDADDVTTGQIQITKANNTATGGGQIYLNGTIGNRIDFNQNGVAAPSFTTRSAGTKIVLYPNVSSSDVDYALGIESSTLWYSIPDTLSSKQHRWYGGTTQLADLKGSGELVIGSTSLTGTASQKLQVTGGAYISGNLGVGATNPSYKLDVDGDIFFYNNAIISAVSGTDNIDHLWHNDATAYGAGGTWHFVSDNSYKATGNSAIRAGAFVNMADTGTASQKLQITGGGYISGNLGVGATNPTAKLTVDGSGTANTGTTIARFRNSSSQNRIDIIDETTTGTRPPGILSPSASYGLGLYAAGGPIRFYPASTSTEKVRIDNSGNLLINTTSATGTSSQPLQVSGGGYFSGDVGIGTDTPAYKLEVNGSFAATTKSFVIDHPTKEGMKLRYGSLEGPENGIYVRGRLKGNNTIELPEYWTNLVDEDSITVNLTPIGRKAPLHSVVDIADNTVVVESANDVVDCFYTVFGERKDVEKLEVEF